MCEWFDITVGQLVDFIEAKGIEENTLFVYITDNGWIQDPDRPNRYAPRSKREPYDMGIRTPVIYRWTGHIEPEMDTLSLTSSIDIATTLLATCGLEPTEAMQGIDMLDKTLRKQRDALFAETYAHDFSTVDSSLYYRIIITNPWKLILPDPVGQPHKGPELYNLDTDPFEWENQAANHPEIVESLKIRLEAWWIQ
jgi:arylsulfatase A-like enzyme